jgi:hypothetical protein
VLSPEASPARPSADRLKPFQNALDAPTLASSVISGLSALPTHMQVMAHHHQLPCAGVPKPTTWQPAPASLTSSCVTSDLSVAVIKQRVGEGTSWLPQGDESFEAFAQLKVQEIGHVAARFLSSALPQVALHEGSAEQHQLSGSPHALAPRDPAQDVREQKPFGSWPTNEGSRCEGGNRGACHAGAENAGTVNISLQHRGDAAGAGVGTPHALRSLGCWADEEVPAKVHGTFLGAAAPQSMADSMPLTMGEVDLLMNACDEWGTQ